MVRELAIILYLFSVKITFILFKLSPQRKKTVFISSFGDNVFFVWEKVLRETDHETVILQLPGTKGEFEEDRRTSVIKFDFAKNFRGFIKGVYHLATCKVVFIDNYYGLLAATPFKENVKCIQLWHANGAIKRFGLKDPSIRFRSEKAYKRFRSVYKRFDYITVGSDRMEDIFREAFYVEKEVMLKTGIPRTDIFYDEPLKEKISEELNEKYPMISGNKVILYAPTFRDQQLKKHSIKLDIKKIYQELKEDHVLLIRLHPAILKGYNNNYPDFIIDVSEYPDANHLLFITDYLITDYSSIPFEFSLLEKPMIFYPYDLDEYKQSRGFWEDYDLLVPGPIADNTDDIIRLIKENDFDLEELRHFSDKWNQYNDGHASQKLISEIYKKGSSN
ncbi:CDP-glycerol--glycerophosphate glycerophosphotransferase [Halalkalibacillus sediminis]|uniref:CDP-glycerol--glycerophosphate glycerophosphotransferase n=1 Tax=Halalkalibacillus sediminis TaxID=2018042 RepID=A0A2I0QTZ2_9BACI|nr:CDP-glycerol glycerophosphotransferase family protein [Halalkalibacillus sediminis]PKR77779.1 CDP-glycerol--glycerophosphate glycerophosphotransferase [Halalkalibacillus sediminis]